MTTSRVDAAIARLLDRLETDEAGEALLARLKAREAGLDALRRQLAATATQQELVLPTQAELEVVYRKKVARVESLLTGRDQIVAANALLKEMLGEVRLWGDPEAQDGVRIDLRGEAAQLLQPHGGTQESAPWGAGLALLQISVVAGACNQRYLRLVERQIPNLAA